MFLLLVLVLSLNPLEDGGICFNISLIKVFSSRSRRAINNISFMEDNKCFQKETIKAVKILAICDHQNLKLCQPLFMFVKPV